MKPDLQNVLLCLNELSDCKFAVEHGERGFMNTIIWELDWLAELHRELAKSNNASILA